MQWFKLSDLQEVNLKDYLINWLAENPETKIYIGCDSQNHSRGRKTIYATVIVLHRKGNGGHVLFNKSIFPTISSQFERLWKEVELSMEAVSDLESIGLIKPDFVDVDLNPDPKMKSNNLLRAAVGLIESKGINARYKSLSPWAVSVADHICK
jgi:predicted RNase H-related nuclease YkuK (DUF458 family)